MKTKKITSIIALLVIALLSCMLLTSCGEVTITKAEAEEIVSQTLSEEVKIAEFDVYTVVANTNVTIGGKTYKTTANGTFRNEDDEIDEGLATYTYNSESTNINNEIYYNGNKTYIRNKTTNTVDTTDADILSELNVSAYVESDLFNFNTFKRAIKENVTKKNIAGGFTLSFDLALGNFGSASLYASIDFGQLTDLVLQMLQRASDSVNKLIITFNNNNEITAVEFQLSANVSVTSATTAESTQNVAFSTSVKIAKSTASVIAPAWVEDATTAPTNK